MKGAAIFIAQIALSSLGSAAIGSLITVILIHFWPESTAKASLLLWLSIFVFAFIGVFLFGAAVVGLCGPIVNSISSPFGLFWKAGAIGAVGYFLVNLGIASMLPQGGLTSFFSTRAFIIPVVLGFIFGSLFGLHYYVIRRVLAIEVHG